MIIQSERIMLRALLTWGPAGRLPADPCWIGGAYSAASMAM